MCAGVASCFIQYWETKGLDNKEVKLLGNGQVQLMFVGNGVGW